MKNFMKISTKILIVNTISYQMVYYLIREIFEKWPLLIEYPNYNFLWFQYSYCLRQKINPL